MLLRKWFFIAAMLIGMIGSGGADAKQKLRIAIGHQSTCVDTYSGGIIVKELHLLEKYLPNTGQYQDVEFDIDWKDYASGPPITNMMLANKLDFGVMGDYPLLVNGSKFQETNRVRTLLVSNTGYNLHGSGNAVVVPTRSAIHRFEDLAGKSLSVPFGSAAWGMVLKAAQDKGINPGDLNLRDQSPPVGAANIAEWKIDAHADFCPWPELIEFRDTGRKVFDGSEAEVPYLHGVVVRKDYAEQYPEVVVAFIKAIVDAGRWVEENPIRAAESLERWTGIEKEVQYLYFGPGGHLTLDPSIKPRWVETLKFDHAVLAREKKAPPLDVDQWVTDQYIRQAYKELNVDYERQSAELKDPRALLATRPAGEIWHAKKGIVAYTTVADLIRAVVDADASHEKIHATYVYDRHSGLKVFGKTAFYAQGSDGTLSPFMRKSNAETDAVRRNGAVKSYADSLSDVKIASAGSSSSRPGAQAQRTERKHDGTDR